MSFRACSVAERVCSWQMQRHQKQHVPPTSPAAAAGAQYSSLKGRAAVPGSGVQSQSTLAMKIDGAQKRMPKFPSSFETEAKTRRDAEDFVRRQEAREKKKRDEKDELVRPDEKEKERRQGDDDDD